MAALKRVLIISPYFPPCNAADMQRVRMSLPYFKEFGWDAEVVCIDPAYADIDKDELLLEGIPEYTIIHRVKALKKSLTSKLGLGSIALRSLWYYRKKVNRLLKAGSYDLIYFSTTQFPVCILGAYWKKRFGVHYVIDLQDPWHSDYYQTKPKNERPKKYWFSYRLNKYLEPKALKQADGLISVSPDYIKTLVERYQELEKVPAETITFGAFAPDMKVAADHCAQFPSLLSPDHKNVVYIGRGGVDMHKAIGKVFALFSQLLQQDGQWAKNIKFYFIGTSYAPAGTGIRTIVPLAVEYGLANHVVEIPDRISYYHTLTTLQQADALFMPGSDDPKYTASKIYPYILTKKLLLAVFHPQSPALDVLEEFGVKNAYNYEGITGVQLANFLKAAVDDTIVEQRYSDAALKKYSALEMTLKQCQLFERVLAYDKN